VSIFRKSMRRDAESGCVIVECNNLDLDMSEFGVIAPHQFGEYFADERGSFASRAVEIMEHQAPGALPTPYCSK